MALTGAIRVNDRTIGTWSAVRKPGIDLGPRAVYGYACHANLLPATPGAPTGPTVTFDLTHTYSDGALVLASKVTAAAAELLATPATY